MPDDLTKALLLEEIVAPEAIARALFASLTGGVPILQALVDAGAMSPEVLARHLARSPVPFLRQVVVVPELADKLPPGLCARLLAVPVRRDAITGTVDVAIADATDAHAAAEIAFHLRAPIRIIRAPMEAIAAAVRRLRGRPRPSLPTDDERIYDSRPRGSTFPANADPSEPPVRPSFIVPTPATAMTPLAHATERPSPISVPPPSRGRRNTPTWGTPIHTRPPATEPPPRSGLGSEIPIPLTRRAIGGVSGGTQRPPPLMNPARSGLGEGYPLAAGQLEPVVELPRNQLPRFESARPSPSLPARASYDGTSMIPGPPPLPAAQGMGTFAAYAPQLPFAEMGGILSALRAAGSRDEVLELVLTGARMVASRVALFVVKRGGYLGWACTPEFAERGALQSVLVPLDSNSVFDTAVREDVYLGPIRHDAVHATLLAVMRVASRDVALVPVRVSGKTAVIIVADELGDTMLSTRRLEEIARAAGDAFARIVRSRR